ncbi:uncharacterized protein LOC131940890 [Physella acuta]|uniref:uncharacterized protein LOC131940890 n=1 Tax=Physella acuta TaxID=109671 RepID=UPI0027DCF3C1|nr:uncharacterized protein LOC131940890 [Physella acuta]
MYTFHTIGSRKPFFVSRDSLSSSSESEDEKLYYAVTYPRTRAKTIVSTKCLADSRNSIDSSSDSVDEKWYSDVTVPRKCKVHIETETVGESSRGRNLQRKNTPLSVSSTSGLQVHTSHRSTENSLSSQSAITRNQSVVVNVENEVDGNLKQERRTRKSRTRSSVRSHSSKSNSQVLDLHELRVRAAMATFTTFLKEKESEYNVSKRH